MWETPEEAGRGAQLVRFIPTHMGNTFHHIPVHVESTVHPHACGKHLMAYPL
mgnify:CR=1 FL=1